MSDSSALTAGSSRGMGTVKKASAVATIVVTSAAVSCLGRYLTPLYRDMVDSSWF
jgi:hypothetical protein